MCGCMQGAQVEGRRLSEEDLKLVARLGNLLTQRPQGPRGQTMNHKVIFPFILLLCSSGGGMDKLLCQ